MAAVVGDDDPPEPERAFGELSLVAAITAATASTSIPGTVDPVGCVMENDRPGTGGPSGNAVDGEPPGGVLTCLFALGGATGCAG